jgi:membrane associated rhomboid family serine protease
VLLQPQRFNVLPPVIKNLLIINGLAFMATLVFGQMGFDIIRQFGMYIPQSQQFAPYQLVTHLFLHANMSHIFFNMFALWMFGNALENQWGSQRFLIFYLVTGLGAAMCHLGVNVYEYYHHMALYEMTGSEASLQSLRMLEWVPTVGASGAVFGVLLGFGMTYPNQKIYLYFLMPIKAKYFVLGYGLMELWSGFAQASSNIAHFAHVGGMLFGFLLIRYWKSTQRRF